MAQLDGRTELTFSDGRKVIMRVDFEAMMLAEEAAGDGVRFADILAQIGTEEAPGPGPSMRIQRALFYGMLKQDMPDLTPTEAGNLLLREATAFEAGMKAMGRSMPEAPATDEEAGEEGGEGPTKEGASN